MLIESFEKLSLWSQLIGIVFRQFDMVDLIDQNLILFIDFDSSLSSTELQFPLGINKIRLVGFLHFH